MRWNVEGPCQVLSKKAPGPAMRMSHGKLPGLGHLHHGHHRMYGGANHV